MKKQLLKLILPILLLIPFVFIGCQSNKQEKSTDKIIYLVRHAEKDLTDSTNNPPLTIQGTNRANKLKDLLQNEGITGIYATKYQRTINTVKPLADAQNLAINEYDYHTYADLLTTIKNSKSEQRVLIGGHSDTLLPMIDYLNGQRPQESIGHNEYDKLFKLTVMPDTAFVEMIIF